MSEEACHVGGPYSGGEDTARMPSRLEYLAPAWAGRHWKMCDAVTSLRLLRLSLHVWAVDQLELVVGELPDSSLIIKLAIWKEAVLPALKLAIEDKMLEEHWGRKGSQVLVVM